MELCDGNWCCYTFYSCSNAVALLTLVVQLQQMDKYLKQGHDKVVIPPVTSHNNVVMAQASFVQEPGNFPAILSLLMEKQEMKTTWSLIFSLHIYIG